MRQLRGLSYLAYLTARRQFFAKKTLFILVLVGLIGIATLGYVQAHTPGTDAEASRWDRETVRFIKRIVIGIYVGFLLPLISLVYATAAFGEEREQRTLIYLLVRPLSRFKIYFAKALGLVPVITFAGLTGFASICWAGGELSADSWARFWPAIAQSCVAYSILFLFFGAVLPRPAVLAVVYTFFVETLVGAMPGTLKRIAVSFYCRCLMYDAGEDLGLEPSERNLFLPIEGSTAGWILASATIACLLIGAFIFHRKEYRDLT